MHSTIYQISTEPIAERDYLRLENIVAGEMVSISSIYGNDEDGRRFDIKCLVEQVLPKGMFVLSDENTLTYKGGFDKWKKAHFDRIKELSAQLTPANVMRWEGPMGKLKKAITNPLGTDAIFVMEFYGGGGDAQSSEYLMDMVANLNIGDKLYIGSVLGYYL